MSAQVEIVVCSNFLEEISSSGKSLHIHRPPCLLTATRHSKITAKSLQRCFVLIALSSSLLFLKPSAVVIRQSVQKSVIKNCSLQSKTLKGQQNLALCGSFIYKVGLYPLTLTTS